MTHAFPRGWSPEAASEIDMDMYVQFHGWLMEKRFFHIMMIFVIFFLFIQVESSQVESRVWNAKWNEWNLSLELDAKATKQ